MADPLARARLRRNLGDTGTSPAFTDAELDLLLDERQGDELRALVQGLWELLSGGARFSDYTTGLTSTKKSQVFDHVERLYRMKRTELSQRDVVSPDGTGRGATLPTRTVSLTNRIGW